MAVITWLIGRTSSLLLSFSFRFYPVVYPVVYPVDGIQLIAQVIRQG